MMKKYILILVVGFAALLMGSCSGDDKKDGGKPSKSELKARIKVMEDSLVRLQASLNEIKQIPNLTHQELINRLLDYYHNYPEDMYSAECLDKVHMKYTGMNIPERAVQYADTLLMKYPKYPNRSLVLESQGSSYDATVEMRDTSKVRYYYELLIKENPTMDKDKKAGLMDRLDHLEMTFDEFIEYRMSQVP